jgi:DNA-binding IclR family transcriptional regulator
VEDGEVSAGFASVAAAVVDHTGRPVAGLAVTFRSEAYDDAGRVGLAEQATRAAEEVSRRLGAR